MSAPTAEAAGRDEGMLDHEDFELQLQVHDAVVRQFLGRFAMGVVLWGVLALAWFITPK